MFGIYGELLPLRKLEEIIHWKKREKERAAVIRAAVPDLEPAYVQWLEDWEHVFSATQEQAQQFLHQAALDRFSDEPGETDGWDPVSELWDNALQQSREFVRQLDLLRQSSHSLREVPVFPALMEAIRRESDEHEDTESIRRETDEHEEDSLENALETQPADGPLRPEGTWSDPLVAGGGIWATGHSRIVPIGGHKLPPLPYPYNALEPWIDEQTMRIHHDKHHQAYVDGLNKAEKKMEESRQSGDFELVKHWERELAFNGAGHYLHSIFWEAMKPGGGGRPSGALAAEINRSFGGFDAFKKHFSEAANKVEGGGWAILVWSPRSRRLEILTAEKHQNLSQWDVIPLLPLDVWEHAYYLKHQNDRAAYIRDWWNVVNWPYVANRYAKARTL